LASRAAGEWNCDASRLDGSESRDAALSVDGDGEFTLEIEGETFPGAWELSGETLEVSFEEVLAYTYHGVSSDPDEIDVSEGREPESGRFDVDVDGSTRVVLTQTEWFDNQTVESLDGVGWQYDCTKAT